MGPYTILPKVILAALFWNQCTASTAPPGLPLNGQYGAPYFPLECIIGGSAKQTFKALFTATCPVTGGLGQAIYYTDATARVEIPQSNLLKTAKQLGATQLSAHVNVSLDLTHASPKSIPVFPNGLYLQNISIPDNDSIIVYVPGGKKVIPPIGPVTLASTKGQHLFYLGEMHMKIDLYDAKGKQVLTPISVNCPVQDPDIILGIVGVQHPAGLPPLKLFSGGARTFPEVPLNYEDGSYRFPYTCDFDSYGAHDVDLSITGSVKTVVKPGEEYSVANATSYLRIDGELAKYFIKKTPGIKTVRTTLKEFYITTTEASPKQINALPHPYTYVRDADPNGFAFSIPPKGVLQVGPITANNKTGETSYIGVGSAAAVVELLGTGGKVLKSLKTSCRSKVPVELIGFPITNKVPGKA